MAEAVVDVGIATRGRTVFLAEAAASVVAQRRVALLEQSPECAFAFGPYVAVDAGGRDLERLDRRSRLRPPARELRRPRAYEGALDVASGLDRGRAA